MKSIKLLLLVYLFFLSDFSYGQFSVLVDQIMVDNQSSTSISFGNKTSVNVDLHALVNATSSPNDSFLGSIKVYYKKNSSSPVVTPVGGYGGDLFFLDGTQAGRNFDIDLDATQFDNSGGVLYVEYKSFSGISYKCTDINITKSGVNPTVPTIPSGPTDQNFIVGAHNTSVEIINETEGYGYIALYGSQMNNYSYEWQINKGDGLWLAIPNQTSQWFNDNRFQCFVSGSYRRVARKNTIVKISNEIQIITIPAPTLENNAITLSGSHIQGSTPNGGRNSYTYNWYVYILEGEDPWLFQQNTKDFTVPNSVYAFMDGIGSDKSYITREVMSGSQRKQSNVVVVYRANDITNNVIALSGNNSIGYSITGSLPTGGNGIFKYEYFLYNEYDGEVIGEVEKVGDDQNYFLPPRGYALPIKIYRKVTSGNKVITSNSVTILPVGVYAKNAGVSKQSVLMDNFDDNLKIYPNPTTESINFATNLFDNKEVEIMVYSEGLRDTKSIFKGTVSPNQVINWKIPSSYPKGLYFYKILSDNKEVKSGKILYQ
jgi:hypothetical protein